MGWKEERDALIAQTLAFVEQVTGKPADFSKLAPAPAAATLPGAQGTRPSAISNAAPAGAKDSHPALAATASDELERDIALAVLSLEPAANGTSETASGSPVQAAASPEAEEQLGRAEDEASPANSFRAEPFKSAVSPTLAAQLGMQRDMQDEIRTRVAKFRAHQERFNRERQEYFSSTLARLRASMERTSRDDK
ncbi:conserved hypothetical protein [Bradyrhizobium sp. STM 3843]|uniref:hypothetical protein n=1 Tax=Bradyrhizobium sp. STM 3843 TaxID=551947 RepID=UPI00024087B9|nr:hypothetical protein [Bradyrhizobium sp. STM 3843]CCE04487.1 conserved hypothetical protein [Bradyrhizobium sp. STM 3843]